MGARRKRDWSATRRRVAGRIPRPARWVAGWDLWAAPARVVGWVLAVDLLSLGATALLSVLVPVGAPDWKAFGLLALCAVLHIELSRSIEHKRELTAGAGPYLDLKSVWNFAALLVLPPALASAMVVLTYGYAWLRVWRGRRPMVAHRWLYSCCTVLAANQAALAVLQLSPDPYPGPPASLAGLAVVAIAGTLRWALNYLLVIVVIMLADPRTRIREVIGNLGEQVLEVGAMGLGLLAAGVIHRPVLLAGVLLALFALHRSVLLGQFQKAAQTDAKTGLYNADWWTRLAKNSLERTARRGGTFGVLMLDVDFFKRVNDTHGHPAGDELLVAIARTLRGVVRAVDIVGRFGGEEFVVALPDVDAVQLLTVGERLRSAVRALNVPVTSARPEVTELSGITVSIGAALYPATGETVEDLLLAADAALLSAKSLGRDRLEPAAGVLPPGSGSVRPAG